MKLIIYIILFITLIPYINAADFNINVNDSELPKNYEFTFNLNVSNGSFITFTPSQSWIFVKQNTTINQTPELINISLNIPKLITGNYNEYITYTENTTKTNITLQINVEHILQSKIEKLNGKIIATFNKKELPKQLQQTLTVIVNEFSMVQIICGQFIECPESLDLTTTKQKDFSITINPPSSTQVGHYESYVIYNVLNEQNRINKTDVVIDIVTDEEIIGAATSEYLCFQKNSTNSSTLYSFDYLLQQFKLNGTQELNVSCDNDIKVAFADSKNVINIYETIGFLRAEVQTQTRKSEECLLKKDELNECNVKNGELQQSLNGMPKEQDIVNRENLQCAEQKKAYALEYVNEEKLVTIWWMYVVAAIGGILISILLILQVRSKQGIRGRF